MSQLSGLMVVDLGAGMAPALITKFLRELGARVIRVPPQGGDPFERLYPAYGTWRRDQLIDQAAVGDESRIETLLSRADVCLVGGEDHPDLLPRRDAAKLAEAHPRLIVLEITGFPASSPEAARPGVDLLIQARAGLVFEHFSAQPNVISFQPSNYGATFQGLIGLFTALLERELSGRGQVVSTSLLEGALTWATTFQLAAERPDARFNFTNPKDTVPLIFRCEDGVYIHIVLGSTGAKYRLYQVLGIDDPSVDPSDIGAPSMANGPHKFFGDVDLLDSRIRVRRSRELLQALWDAGIAAEVAGPPGACWSDPQVEHNRLIVTTEDGARHVGLPIVFDASPARAAPSRPSPKALPLEGLRVVDFGTYVAGPFAAVALGDLGAGVIKVEAFNPDPCRISFRMFSPANRGKRAITLNLKTDEGRAIAQQLCAGADVVLSNFRPGAAARLGIDADSLRKTRPDLIVLETSGFGPTGPSATRSGFDPMMQAFCGHEVCFGGEGNPPLWNIWAFVDFAAGLMGSVAIMAALYHRARTGGGARLDVSLLNTGIFLLSELIQASDGTFHGAPPLNALRTGYRPTERLYQARDGWIVVAARGAAAARRFAEALDLADVATKPGDAWAEAEATAMSSAVRKRGRSELLAALNAAGVWADSCDPAKSATIIQDPALIADGTVHHIDHPDYGRVTCLGPMFRLSRSRREAQKRAPMAGEHTRELLSELGYAAASIEDLLDKKVVAEWTAGDVAH
jgi:crotonobetainyl-CoA:carnitine CoA-transferase CaiB-like acyl-CoA transferase